MIEVIFKTKLDDETAAVLQRVLAELADIKRCLMTTDEAIQRLAQEVAENGSVVESAMTLIQGLAERLEAAKDDPQQLQAIIDQIAAQKAALAQAVAANTPAA